MGPRTLGEISQSEWRPKRSRPSSAFPQRVWFDFRAAERPSTDENVGAAFERSPAYHHFVQHAYTMLPSGYDAVAEQTRGATPVNREDVSLALFANVAGIDSTATLISMLLWHLTRAQKQDMAVLRDAVDEALRLASPIRFVSRQVRLYVRVGGHELTPGAVLQLNLGAANRDANRFPHPNAFNPSRPNVRDHLALGRGVHTCLGGMLARLEAETAVRTILEMRPHLQMTEHDDDYAVAL